MGLGLSAVILGGALAILGASGRVERKVAASAQASARAAHAIAYLRRDLLRLQEHKVPGGLWMTPAPPDDPEAGSQRLGMVLYPRASGAPEEVVSWHFVPEENALVRGTEWGGPPMVFPLGEAAQAGFHWGEGPGTRLRYELEAGAASRPVRVVGEVVLAVHSSVKASPFWNRAR
jgi:hypothetical protein